MPNIKFDEYRGKIEEALRAKIFSRNILVADPEGYILLEGFMNTPFQKDIGANFVLGGPTLPTVAIIGKSTGVIYTFALKALIPDVQL